LKAALIENFGEPLKIKEVQVKTDQNEVIVNVKASGICGRDLVVWKGGFKNLKLPLIPGHEIFGELNGTSVGVFGAITCGKCKYCLSGKENLCESLTFLGEGKFGGYAEKVSVPKENIFPLPDSNYEKYAAAACPLATAIHAAKVAEVKKGESVLVTGAGGGVGIHTIQYFKKIGLKVFSVTSESKKEIVSKYSDAVITEKEFSKYIKDVDAVFEIVGANTINESLKILKKEGRLVLIGNVDGKNIELIRPALSIMREHKIIGSAAFTKKEYLESVDLIHRGDVKPYYRTYPLDDVNKAYQDIIQGKITGRGVLLP